MDDDTGTGRTSHTGKKWVTAGLMILMFGVILMGMASSATKSAREVKSIGIEKRNRSLVDYGSDAET